MNKKCLFTIIFFLNVLALDLCFFNMKVVNSAETTIDVTGKWDYTAKYAECGSEATGEMLISLDGYSYDGQDWHHDCKITDGYSETGRFAISAEESRSGFQAAVQSVYDNYYGEDSFTVLITEYQTTRIDIQYHDNRDGSLEVMALLREGGPYVPTPPDAVLSVTPTNIDAETGSGTAIFNISNTGDGSKAWNVSVIAGNDWLSIASDTAGSDDGPVTVHYDTNTKPFQRTGSIRVTASDAQNSPVVVTVTQQAASCAYSISHNSGDFPAGGGTDFVTVTTSDADCTWTTFENFSWANLSPSSGGESQSTLSVTVDSNAGAARNGAVTIAGRTYSINQAGASEQTTLFLTSTSPNHTITSNSDVKVYGIAASNQLSLESGAKAELINFPGFNSVQVQSNSDAFQVSRSGSVVTFEGSDGTVLKIPATTSVQTITFTDRYPLTLSIYEGRVMLDDQMVITTPMVITSGGDDTTFKATNTQSAYGSNQNQVCVNEFGSEWEQADWAALENYYSGGGNMYDLILNSGLDTKKNAWVTRNGNQSYSSTRDYIVSYHNHSKPSYYLTHDNIDNYLLSLGSWYGSYYVLCKKKVVVEHTISP